MDLPTVSHQLSIRDGLLKTSSILFFSSLKSFKNSEATNAINLFEMNTGLSYEVDMNNVLYF